MKEVPRTRIALTATLFLFLLILLVGSAPLWLNPRSFENSWLLKLTDNLLWTPVSTVVLILTLLTILVYTYQTYKIAKFQGEEIGLHKHPVIAVQFDKEQWLREKRSKRAEDDPKFEFLTVVYNLSNVHATAWLRASLWMKSTRKWELLYQFHEREQFYLYSGLRSWTLQAKSTFRGNLDLKTIPKRLLQSENAVLEE
ncbi:MAG: hypothetical protein Kow0074_03450 [Candidatus Zixiibacteriota bacterium]